MNMPKTLIVMGRSGSGKGTQIELLKEKYQGNEIFHFEAGAMFRELLNSGTYTSEIIRTITQQGGLVPDFLTNGLFIERMSKNFTSPEQLIVFDGYPRSFEQADMLDTVLKYYKREQITVLHIEVSEQEVRARMATRGRYDDKDTKTLENRIKFYNESVLPTLERYRNKEGYNVIDINGERDVDTIHQDIIKQLTQ